MGKATRQKCTALCCLAVVVVPLLVFILSAFFAVWLYLLEADEAGCFLPGGEEVAPSPLPTPTPESNPDDAIGEEGSGSGSGLTLSLRQLSSKGAAGVSSASALMSQNVTISDVERPICEYYQWCAQPN